MPNWKKVIVSGSSAALTSVTATTGFTGSLSGSALSATSASFATTASYILNAVSASYAPSAGAAFPYTGSAIISGSLTVTGSLFVQDFGKTNIDSSTRQLYDAGPVMPPGASSVLSIDWASRTLNDSNGNSALAWRDRALYTSNAVSALNWSDDTLLTSDVYQRDYKSSATQDLVSTNYNNSSTSYLGDIIEVNNSVSSSFDNAVADGMLVYLYTDGIWYPVAQADPRATSLLGIAHNVGGNAGFVLLEGHVVIDDYGAAAGPIVKSAALGAPVYIRDSTTTGVMSTVVPTTTGSNNIVRVLGHCYQRNSGTATQWMMKFRPSNDWVEI